MAEVPLPTPTDNAVPSTDIRDAVYAGAMLDKVVTSTDLTYTDRLGGEHYTVDGIKAEGDKVVEETRQNLIPLSRQYMTLAAAQADIANIPEGSTTYYRSPDDSALAIEVINNGGTLEPTGRKMPSYDMVIQAVLAEFMERSSIIFEGENSSLLSLCDYFGYEVGKVTENSFETRKVKIVQMDSGPGFMLVDDFGNAVDVLSERFTLVAGNNELTDSESLLSFPDEFGNELILVDSKGRQRVGDNLIFDAPDWAQCTTDQFGFVIFGYKLDGTFVGKDNGGSGGEPVPSILETGSVDHWLFGYPDTSMVGRVHGRILSPQSTPEFNKNYVSLSAWGGALVT
ncbi:hypothetical protein AB8Q93_21220, partial [Klebsiella pneumoniae subsp. ozaenae]